jgi:hypothetical protein
MTSRISLQLTHAQEWISGECLRLWTTDPFQGAQEPPLPLSESDVHKHFTWAIERESVEHRLVRIGIGHDNSDQPAALLDPDSIEF